MDVQTTLVELVAASVARALEFFTRPKRLLVCGGGVHNAYLMRRLAARLPDSIVESTARYGADPDWVDGMLFAWLARERLKRSARDASHITGAGRPVLLGDVYEP
jgi:anhydro-N-acetylmuramic acid kinase